MGLCLCVYISLNCPEGSHVSLLVENEVSVSLSGNVSKGLSGSFMQDDPKKGHIQSLHCPFSFLFRSLAHILYGTWQALVVGYFILINEAATTEN